jgi:hypothetical protein
MGSKNKIARKIIDVLPSGSAFVDLFCNRALARHGQLDLFGEYVA